MRAPEFAPDPLDDELALLLHADPVPPPARAAAARERLLQRVRRSAAAARRMHMRRQRDLPQSAVAPGVTMQLLYGASGDARRPGEPQRTALLTLQPGAHWSPAPAGPLQREWLVLQGEVDLGAARLALQDFHLRPAGTVAAPLRSDAGARLLLREAPLPPRRGDRVLTQRGAAGWEAFGPGIERRVMWQRDGQAAMLYRTLAGASVPGHRHHHDEECLMLAGDAFLDDVLLRPLDYQLAPAGTAHRCVSTDTGVVLYAHGDLQLAFEPG